MLVKPIASLHGNKKSLKSKVIENRRTDLKNIFKTFDDIRKKELERSKKLYEDHLSLFAETETVEPQQTSLVTDDQFFEK